MRSKIHTLFSILLMFSDDGLCVSMCVFRSSAFLLSRAPSLPWMHSWGLMRPLVWKMCSSVRACVCAYVWVWVCVCVCVFVCVWCVCGVCVCGVCVWCVCVVWVYSRCFVTSVLHAQCSKYQVHTYTSAGTYPKVQVYFTLYLHMVQWLA